MFAPAPETSLAQPASFNVLFADVIPAMKMAHGEMKETWAALTRNDVLKLTEGAATYALARGYDHPT